MVPQIVKDTFYKTFQSPDNYKKIPDQPWRLTDISPLMKLISKEK